MNDGKLFSAGKSAFPFLLIVPSARASALGEAYAGIAEGPEGAAFNPGGLALEKRRSVSLQHVFFVDGILYDNLFYAHPLQKGAWAAHMGFLNSKGLKKTVADSASQDGFRELEDFSTNDFLAEAFYARTITRHLSAGAGIKMIRESLSDNTSVSGAFDLGALYQDSALPISAGISLQNLGPKAKFQDESFALPAAARAGISFRQTKNFAPSWVPEQSLLSLETARMIDGSDQTASAGIEVPFLNRKLLGRSGYHYHLKKQNLGYKVLAPNGFSLGVGLSMGGWTADYSASSFGDLGLIHRITLTMRIGHD